MSILRFLSSVFARGGPLVAAASLLVGASQVGAQTVSPTTPSRLINLSVRAKLAAGEQLFVGFTIWGAVPLVVPGVSDAAPSIPMLVRAVGPSLQTFGVTDALSSPKLRLVYITNSSTQQIAENSDWSTALTSGVSISSVFNAAGAFPLKEGSRDAAISTDFKSGTYTAIVSGTGPNDAGVVLAEAYDVSEGSDPLRRLINLSVRSKIDRAEGLIGGFIITGDMHKRVLIRVVGPTLKRFNVLDAVADPKLELMDRTGTVIAANDNWSGDTLMATATNAVAAAAVGAFPLDDGSKDAAVVIDLPPGLYTVRASSADGSTGTGLLEIYEYP